MAPGERPEPSLRLDRLETSRLAWAFAISVALHLLIWGTYTEGKREHIWEKLHAMPWVQALLKPLRKPVIATAPPLNVNQEPPLLFVDVSPVQAVTEPPKNAIYYSDKNSVAANPDPKGNADVPKITGTQTEVPKTEDAPRNRFDKLQPSPPAPQERKEEQARPQPVVSPGDLTLARPQTNFVQDNGLMEQPRPRTIKEARARMQDDHLAGRKMKQEGGARRPALVPSFDVRASPFGLYDRQFIEAVEQCWFDELDSIHYDGARLGRVALQFHLNSDGRISDMKVVENTVGETLGLICERAVLAPAPYDKWPREMRLMVGEDFRQIQFTFLYTN